LDNAFEEECGVLYSSDGIRLLRMLRLAFHDDSYSIEPGTQVICDGAFAWCGRLKEITIPDSITCIGKDVFEQCDSLSKIHIPAGRYNKFKQLLPGYEDKFVDN